jgi:hypothetical protein
MVRYSRVVPCGGLVRPVGLASGALRRLDTPSWIQVRGACRIDTWPGIPMRGGVSDRHMAQDPNAGWACRIDTWPRIRMQRGVSDCFAHSYSDPRREQE